MYIIENYTKKFLFIKYTFCMLLKTDLAMKTEVVKIKKTEVFIFILLMF